jgi:outer membrane protein assembly factor BamB
MQLVKINFVLIFFFLLASCVGPFKELKYQVEDSFEDADSFQNSPSILNDIDNLVDIKVINSSSVDGEIKRNFISVNFGNNYFCITSSGYIYLYNKDNYDLSVLYKHNHSISAGLALDKNKLYFVDDIGYLNAISVNGNLEWKVFVGEVYAAPSVTDGKILLKSTSSIMLYNSIDGSKIWSYSITNNPLLIRSWATPLIEDNTIYSGNSPGNALAIDYDSGLLKWESSFSQSSSVSDIERINEITSNPVVDEFLVFIVSNNGHVAALAKEGGSLLWSRPFSSFYGMTSNSTNLFITHNSGSIYSIAKETGKTIWRNADLQGRDTSKSFLFHDYLIVTDFEGYIHILSTQNGQIISRKKIFSSGSIQPIIINDDGELIFLSFHGDIVQVKIDNKKDKLEINETDSLDLKNEQDKDDKKDNESILDNIIFWD